MVSMHLLIEEVYLKRAYTDTQALFHREIHFHAHLKIIVLSIKHFNIIGVDKISCSALYARSQRI